MDRAGREWRADSYARAIIKTTTYRVYNDMRTRPAEELGIDTVYYSIKRTARVACAPLQGKIVTKGQGRVVNGVTIHSLLDYGYGDAGGCLGVHCGHYLTPFIVGVNTLPDLPDYLKDLTPEQAEENARIEAKQRALERTIRHHKERLHYAKTLGDSELETLEKLQIRKNQGKLKALIDEHDFLGRDYSRERFTGHVSNNTKRGIDEQKASIVNEYNKIRNVLGDYAPPYLSHFTKMWYNNSEQLRELRKLADDVEWMKEARKNTSNTEATPPTVASPNSVIQYYQDGELTQRRYFDQKGRAKLDIDNTDHKQPDKHAPIHAHHWTWTSHKDGTISKSRSRDRELTLAEKIANDDLKGNQHEHK